MVSLFPGLIACLTVCLFLCFFVCLFVCCRCRRCCLCRCCRRCCLKSRKTQTLSLPIHNKIQPKDPYHSTIFTGSSSPEACAVAGVHEVKEIAEDGVAHVADGFQTPFAVEILAVSSFEVRKNSRVICGGWNLSDTRCKVKKWC